VAIAGGRKRLSKNAKDSRSQTSYALVQVNACFRLVDVPFKLSPNASRLASQDFFENFEGNEGTALAAGLVETVDV